MKWYYVGNESEKKGPVSSDELLEMESSGQIALDTLVWRSGFDEWVPLQEVVEQLRNPERMQRCIFSGKEFPESQMLQYGDRYVAAQHKEEFLDSMKAGNDVAPFPQFPDYQDLTGRTKLLKILLFAHVAVTVLWIVSDVWMISSADQITPFSFTPAESFQMRLGVLLVIVAIATTIVFAMWIYRSTANSHALGARGIRFTPGWSVGWYFIPIANLWKPFQAMSETFRSSLDPIHWSNSPNPPILGVWWTLWIVNLIMSRISTRLALGAETSDEIVGAATFSIFESAVFIALCCAAITLISQLQKIHTMRANAPPSLQR